MDERKRESIVAYLRRKMADFEISPEAIAESLEADQRRLKAVRYRNATGQTWDGKGAAPQWVIQATSAGQSLEHFAVCKPPAVRKEQRAPIDWRDDPFAGSRLATTQANSSGTA